jgi:uncharacterized protein YkwD
MLIYLAPMLFLQTAAFCAELRNDLKDKLSSLLCSDAATPDKAEFRPSAKDIWSKNIYDAQVNVQVLNTNKEELLEQKARELAKRLRNKGVSWGGCKDNTGWIASMPSPKNVLSEDGVLEQKVLSENCAKFSVEYVKADGGKSRNIKIKKSSSDLLKLNLSFLESGTLSVTCTTNNNRGPSLWFLYPIKKGALETVPLSEEIKANEIDGWINKIREREGLKPLSWDKSRLSDIAKALGQRVEVSHDVKMLRRLTENIGFLGENRAKDSSLENIAWLFWNSPRHRELLLEKGAKKMGLYLRETQDYKFMVLILSR